MGMFFIMVDQLLFDQLGRSGHDPIKTPCVDAFAAEVVRFNQACGNRHCVARIA